MPVKTRVRKVLSGGRRTRGQLLSVDFLVSVSLIALCCGVVLQMYQAGHDRAANQVFFADNKAESIAALVHSGESVPANAVYCARETLLGGEVHEIAGGCASFSCGGRGKFAAMRVEVCNPSPTATPPVPSPSPAACVLEVFTCS